MTRTVLAALVLFQVGTNQPGDPKMQADVDRLVLASQQLTGTWPLQPPPPIPEVAFVARHGRPLTPLLLALLSDDPNIQSDDKRWKVQQQVSLVLSQIYSESPHCGRTYCDGDAPERIGHVKAGWQRVIASDAAMRALSSKELLDRFKQETVFWRQFEIGRALASTGDRTVIVEIAPWLAHDDRHLRGNAAFVIGQLGDPRGFSVIAEMLADRSTRGPGQGVPVAPWSVAAQIRTDRYYAAHLLGDLKDPRGVDLLVPLLGDNEVSSIVPWSLAEIGESRAISPLISELDRNDPTARVLAILALERLNAREALTKLRELQSDDRRANFGNQLTVAAAAKHAIAVVSPKR